jgi:SAM-dependent methyltransferase
MIHPLRLYADSLRKAHDLAQPRTRPVVRLQDGTVVRLPLERYLAPADATEDLLLSEVRGPVLDVGCGPGRHLHALATRGVFALGVDLSPVAVELARGRGARAIVGSIFDELPGSGTWQSALLLDGNVGIGGAPARLLARIRTLLRADGELLVELDSPNTPTASTLARIETTSGVSSWFRWARLSARDIDSVAHAGGFRARDRWSLEDRWFACLGRL